jgi:hypothetical protein
MLLTTILNAVGVRATTFGDPTYAEPGEIDLIKR